MALGPGSGGHPISNIFFGRYPASTKNIPWTKFRCLFFLTSLNVLVLICLFLWQEESYDLQDRKAFAKFLIDADIRLVSWKSYSVDS